MLVRQFRQRKSKISIEDECVRLWDVETRTGSGVGGPFLLVSTMLLFHWCIEIDIWHSIALMALTMGTNMENTRHFLNKITTLVSVCIHV